MHMMLATFAKVPELALSEEESKRLAEAIERVAVLYDFDASEKSIAWMNLFMCAGGIYGTRMFAFHMRTKAEAEAKAQQGKPRPGVFEFAPGYNPQQQSAAL